MPAIVIHATVEHYAGLRGHAALSHHRDGRLHVVSIETVESGYESRTFASREEAQQQWREWRQVLVGLGYWRAAS